MTGPDTSYKSLHQRLPDPLKNKSDADLIGPCKRAEPSQEKLDG